MTDTIEPDTGDAKHEELIRRFERAWLAGARPAIEEYLGEADAPGPDLLVELAHVDLEFRIKAGDPARAADYFSRFPELASGEAAAGLIAAEYELRRRSDPGLRFEEVAAGYPGYGDRLEGYRDGLTAPHPAAAAPSRPRPWPAAPGYEILDRLGSGGMGVVYKARDERLGRVVALKFLPAEYARDPDRLALFHREARTASALNHPHICTVHDLGEHDGRPFIVLEFVEGRTLRELIGGRPAVAEAARLVGQAARALAVAHAAGVVHRDIKPENLMVRADGYLKVLDFGLARRLPGTAPPGWSSTALPGPGGAAGTVPYMSPEQARAEPPGPASDVFSLGVVLYEAVTGRHPFPADRPLDVLHAIATADPVPPSRLNPEVPAAVDELVGRMLEKDPAARPSAAEVDAALSAPDAAPAAPPPAPRPRPHTVGRGDERAGLWAAFEAAADGAGRMVCVAGEPAATRRHMEAAARLYDPDRHRHLTFQFGQDPGVACLAFGAVALWLLGEPEEALARSRDAVRLAREGSQPSTLALALHFAAVLHQFRGDPAAVREAASEALAIAVEHRFAFWQAGATVLLGWAAAAGGAADGVALLEQGLGAWQATGSETYRAYYLALLADARARSGRADDALAALDEADRAAVTTGERLSEPEVRRLRGELLAGRADDAAEDRLRAALAAARHQQARALELRAAVGLGRLLARRGRADEAGAVVAAAADRAAGLRDTPDMRAAIGLLRGTGP